MPLLQQFLTKLTHLKRGVAKYGTAPHKPVLPLAFVDLFEKAFTFGKEDPARAFPNACFVAAFTFG